jgi:hypothetical protein
VGALALAPIKHVTPQTALAPQRMVSDLAVELASSIDPITPWVTAFETAFANIQTLGKLNEQNPFPLLKTIGANIATYIEELGNGNAGLIPEQIWGNIQTFFTAPWDPGDGIEIPYVDDPTFVANGEYASDYFPPAGQNPGGVSNFVFNANVGQWAGGCEEDDSCTFRPLIPITNFLNTPYSGQLVALIGTLISPFVQLVKSFTAIGEFFEAGDVIGAINELINIPANMTNASLNGAGFLDLTGIVSAIVPDSPLTRVGVNLGGLLNVMPQNGGNQQGGFVPPTSWSGGVGIDSLAVGEPGDLDYAQGIPNGLLGANIGLGQFLADKLLITPPPPPGAQTAAAAPVETPAVEVVADTPVPVEAPAPVETPAEEPAAAIAAVAAVVDEVAPTVVDAVAEEISPAVVDAPEVEAVPAEVAEDPAPKAAAGEASDDDAGDTGSRATDSRRGASDAD